MPRQTRNSMFGRGSLPSQNGTNHPSAQIEMLSIVFPRKSSVVARSQAERIDEEPEDNVCHICMQEYHTGPEPETAVTLLCGHRFGISCLHQWTQVPERNHPCPFCNRHFYPDVVPAAREERQPAQAPPPPPYSLERILRAPELLQQRPGEALVILQAFACEGRQGDNDLFVIMDAEGNRIIMAPTFALAALRRTGHHDMAARVERKLGLNPTGYSHFAGFIGSWGKAILLYLLDTAELYLLPWMFLHSNPYIHALAICLGCLIVLSWVV